MDETYKLADLPATLAENLRATDWSGFLSLRAGLYAMGDGEGKFGPFIYRAEA